MIWGVRAMAALAVLVALSVSLCPHKPVPAAQLAALAGAVEVEHGGSAAHLGRVGEDLFVGDIVRTPAAGGAGLVFRRGPRLRLSPSAEVLILEDGGLTADIGVQLTRGELQAEQPAQGGRLRVDLLPGQVRFGPALTVAEISLSKGLTVVAGEVDLQRPNSLQQVEGGQSLRIDGLMVPLSRTIAGLFYRPPAAGAGPAPGGGPQLGVPGIDFAWPGAPVPAPGPAAGAPLSAQPRPAEAPDPGAAASPAAGSLADTVTLRQATAARVRFRAGSAFLPAPPATALASGDQLQTQGGASTAVVDFASGAAVSLSPESRFQLLRSRISPAQAEGGWRLAAGQAHLNISAQARPVRHTVRVRQISTQVVPGAREADVDFDASSQPPTAAVRAGSLEVAGQRVVAGEQVALAADGPHITPLAGPRVQIFQAQPTTVFARGRPPAVDLTWGPPPAGGQGAPAGEPQTVELAPAGDFSRPLMVETTSRGHLLVDRIAEPGSYAWRLASQPSVVWPLTVLSEPPPECASCRASDVVDNDGGRTTIVFDQKLPTIVLRSAKVAGAVAWRTQVFGNADLDTPVVDQKHAAPRLGLAAEQLTAGSYVWQMVAHGSRGQPLSAPLMNILDIVSDARSSALKIASPENGAVTSDHHVTVAGEARPDGALSVQGEPVKLDARGHFSEERTLGQGVNTLTFRLTAPDHSAQVWTRKVTRQAAASDKDSAP